MSLEGLLTSDYSLIVKKGGNSESAFTSANPDNIFGKLNSQKVSEFMPTDEAVVKLNSSDKPLAFYYAVETILNFKEFKCHVSITTRLIFQTSKSLYQKGYSRSKKGSYITVIFQKFKYQKK